MVIEREGEKWIVKGEGNGWIFIKRFPTKWKAEVALRIFKRGGKVSDYWDEKIDCPEKPPTRLPWKAEAEVKNYLEEIKQLDPTCEEIEEYGKDAVHGEVTPSRGENLWGPKFHNTWGVKFGGRVHIDIGCCGYHLMLDRRAAKSFITFINKRRNVMASNSQKS